MMNDTLVVLALTAFILAYVSHLLAERLRAQGVRRAVMVRLILEVWGVFALIIAAFALISATLGMIPRTGMSREFDELLGRLQTRSPEQIALLIGLLLGALLLFAHLIGTLRKVLRNADTTPPRTDGGSE